MTEFIKSRHQGTPWFMYQAAAEAIGFSGRQDQWMDGKFIFAWEIKGAKHQALKR